MERFPRIVPLFSKKKIKLLTAYLFFIKFLYWFVKTTSIECLHLSKKNAKCSTIINLFSILLNIITENNANRKSEIKFKDKILSVHRYFQCINQLAVLIY